MPESIRDQVLRLLMDNPNTSISGSELASKLHVTRSAVWKAVEGLRKDGFPIEAVTNRGYRLAGESGKISEGGIRAVLQSLSHSIKKENEFWIGWDIQVLDFDIVGVGRGAVPGVHGVVAVVAGQEAGHGLPAASVDFLVEHAAHLLSLAGGQRHFPPPLASGDAKKEPAAWADSSFGDSVEAGVSGPFQLF